jgi:hypothetical protein
MSYHYQTFWIFIHMHIWYGFKIIFPGILEIKFFYKYNTPIHTVQIQFLTFEYTHTIDNPGKFRKIFMKIVESANSVFLAHTTTQTHPYGYDVYDWGCHVEKALVHCCCCIWLSLRFLRFPHFWLFYYIFFLRMYQNNFKNIIICVCI